MNEETVVDAEIEAQQLTVEPPAAPAPEPEPQLPPEPAVAPEPPQQPVQQEETQQVNNTATEKVDESPQMETMTTKPPATGV